MCNNFPIFSSFRSGRFFKIALFWEKIVKIIIFWGKNGKNFTNLGVKIEKNRVISIKICIFRVKSFPPILFFPTHPYFYLAEYSPMNIMYRMLNIRKQFSPYLTKNANSNFSTLRLGLALHIRILYVKDLSVVFSNG